MSTRTITLPLPHKALSPNSRAHWRAKASAAKKYRQAAGLCAAAVRPEQPWKSATVQAVFYHKASRVRDGDNALASLKNAMDGLADGGIIDNDKNLTHLPPVFEICKVNPRVELIITETRAAK